MNTILITGVAGMLGSHLSRYFLDQGHTVVGIDNLSGGYADFIDKRLIREIIDLVNAIDLENIFQKYKPVYVYHLAAYAAEGLSHFIRHHNYTNNVLCSMNVINCCIKYNICKLVFTSSMAVYGVGQPPFSETHQAMPVDPYGIAKYAVEMDLAAAYEQFGLQYSIIRPHNVVGIYQNIWDRYRNVLGIWCRQIIYGEPVTVYGTGEQQRAFSDVQYYMAPMAALLTCEASHGQIFNMGADQHYKIIDVAHMVCAYAKSKGYKPCIIFLEPRKEVAVAYSDHSKATQILGFQDNTNLLHLIQSLFDWAERQPYRAVKTMNYELTNHIYSYWK